MSFKKSISECEREWSINKKLVTVDRQVTRCLPKGLSYFWVQFGVHHDGYAHVIENDQDFDKCAGVPLIPDINKTFHDINGSTPNPLALVADVMALYSDYTRIKTSCPLLYQAYRQYFSGFASAVNKDLTKTLNNVFQNVMANFTQVEEDALQAIEDFKDENYYNAGEDVGKVVGVALAGYLPSKFTIRRIAN